MIDDKNVWMTTALSSTVVGRFAPSPTGDLHLGNLRTAISAHLRATTGGGEFVIRIEDLDLVNSSRQKALRQLMDLGAVAVTTSRPVIYQSERFEIYREYLKILNQSGHTYECFCSRREIAEAAAAPHGLPRRYPGTCRFLTRSMRQEKSLHRPPALRLLAEKGENLDSEVDDIVLVRNDGVPAYNLAVVVDDELQGITQVVRGDDLAHVTPSQKYLQQLLGFSTPEYVHLPLMIGPDGERLSKRHGAVTLGDCLRLGFSANAVRAALLRSLEVGTNGWGQSSSLSQWLKLLL